MDSEGRVTDKSACHGLLLWNIWRYSLARACAIWEDTLGSKDTFETI